MHSLYRCKCVVGYRPYSSSNLIVFNERQIVETTVSLRWNPGSIGTNLDYSTEASQFVSSLTGSTANVTLYDPYMTGVAWAALFDSAAAFTNSSQAAAHHIVLPACGENQDPTKDKCRPFPEIEDPRLRTGGFGDFAHILIKYYYEVSGVRFALDTYFRLQGFSIQHGKTYPQVSMRGVDPQIVVFNQSLANFQLEENKTLEENLESIIKDYDYNVSFCTDPEKKETKSYLMPRSFKEKNVTASEVIKKYLDSVGGSYQSLPTKEFAKRISLCTRANLNQGCSVFYLGIGLYEGYTLTGNVEPNLWNSNREYQMFKDLGYDKNPLGEGEKYKIDNIHANARKAKLKDAKKVQSFPEQFLTYSKRYSDPYSTSGFVWKSSGPQVTTEKVEKTNIYGLNPNGTESIAYLDGEVLSVSQQNGWVLIATNYFLRFCNEDKTKCVNKPIYQESINLTSIEQSLKVGTTLTINQKIGTSTDQNPEFVRFYLPNGNGSSSVTISPSIVWGFAIPVNGLTDEERKDLGLEAAKEAPNGPSTPSSTSLVIGRVGRTGNTTGVHLHAEYKPPRPITAKDLDDIITIGGKAPSSWLTTSTYLAQESFRTKPHQGVDIAGAGIENQPVELINGKVVNSGIDAGGYGNFVVIETRRGQILLAHFANASTAGAKRGVSVGTGSRYSTGVQSAPGVLGSEIQTEFKGVPRALRIVPGRTILSFITKYDEWIESGRSSSIDPGVWIPTRFANWIIKDVNYNWNKGDLRLSLTGFSDWGNTVRKIQVPPFEEYLQSFSQETKYMNGYYGYIRSLGDLCWKLKEGQTSCEVLCSEAQRFEEMLLPSRDGTPDMSGSYPNAQCTYTGSLFPGKEETANQVMGMLRSVGISSKNAYAGVLGNALVESSMDPNVHNVRPGSGCSKTPSKILGTSGYGLFQWCGSRADLLSSSRNCGKNCSQQQQLEFTAEEISTGRDIAPSCRDSNWVNQMNNARSPEEAADLWNKCYERGPGKIGERRTAARNISLGLKCNNPKN